MSGSLDTHFLSHGGVPKTSCLGLDEVLVAAMCHNTVSPRARGDRSVSPTDAEAIDHIPNGTFCRLLFLRSLA